MDEMNKNDSQLGEGLQMKEEQPKNEFAYYNNTSNYNAQPTYGAQPVQNESRALEICSLVFGILGIVLCCCYGIFGIVGLVCSIVALKQGKKSGMLTAGLICSIIGLLFTIGIYAYSFSDAGKKAQEEFMRQYGAAYQQQE